MRFLVEKFKELCQKAGGELVVEEHPLLGKIYRCRLSLSEEVEVFRAPTTSGRDILGIRIGRTSEGIEILRDIPLTVDVIIHGSPPTKIAVVGDANFSVETRARSILLLEDMDVIRIEP